jgi:hypothetical protein
MKLAIQINHAHLTDKLTGLARQQVPFLVSKTINGVALDVFKRIKGQMPVVFDRPTAFAVNALDRKLSNKADLTATVFFKDSAEAQGKSQREFLRPGALGAAARAQKRSEYLLSRRGVLPAGWVLYPGTHFAGKLDAYGNVPGSIYKQVINVLQLKKMETAQAKKISAASQKRSAKMGVDVEFFALPPGNNTLGSGGRHLYPGIYRRAGRRGDVLQQYFKFVRKGRYTKRLDMEKEARTVLETSAQKQWQDAMAYIRKDLAK